eukprot:1190369-Amphidinium_carterae.2
MRNTRLLVAAVKDSWRLVAGLQSLCDMGCKRILAVFELLKCPVEVMKWQTPHANTSALSTG